MPSRTAASRRRITALVLILAVLAAGFFLVRSYQQSVEQDRLEYAEDAKAPAPPGLEKRGLQVASGTGEDVVIYTDLTCHYCQDFFRDNADSLRALVNGGEHDVWLSVLPARQGSQTNRTALTVWLQLVADDLQNPLEAYLAMSSALDGVDDDGDQAAVRAKLSKALSGSRTKTSSLDPMETGGQESDNAAWLSARTYEVRQSTGSVPSFLLNGAEAEPEDLSEAVGLPLK